VEGGGTRKGVREGTGEAFTGLNVMRINRLAEEKEGEKKGTLRVVERRGG